MYMYIYISHDNDNCDIFCIKSIEEMGGATFCMIENYWTCDSRNEDFKLTIPNLSGIYFVLLIFNNYLCVEKKTNLEILEINIWKMDYKILRLPS